MQKATLLVIFLLLSVFGSAGAGTVALDWSATVTLPLPLNTLLKAAGNRENQAKATRWFKGAASMAESLSSPRPAYERWPRRATRSRGLTCLGTA